MRIVDEIITSAPPDLVYQVAADVERWPHILAHYRWVRMHETAPAGGGIVEMSAWRPFPGFRWPTWWTSEMRLDPDRRDVHYRHIKGVTTGMNVVWQVQRQSGRAPISSWFTNGTVPRWPIIGRPAAKLVILPIFVHGIAVLTLAGVSREAERLNA